MRPDSYGFLFPVVENSKCINCGLCTSACPINNKQINSVLSPICFAAYTKSDTIRKESSSGGIFSEVASVFLNHGDVVFGAVYDEKYSVKHICIKSIEQLSKLRGAKYTQSNVDGCFPDILKRLNSGQNVLFAGTPCQVAGLKSFLKKDYPNLFTIDFVCHGVPSPFVWDKYVHYRAQQDNHGVLPQKINLRSKSTGWSRYKYSIEYYYSDKNIHTTINENDLFMQLFIGDYINRESCSNCYFKGYQHCSDITIGDFWGIWDILPEMDDDKGTSVVLIHSDAGKEMFKIIANNVALKNVTLKQASSQNPSMLYSSSHKDNRSEIIQTCLNGNFEAVQYYLNKQAKKKAPTFFSCFLHRFVSKIKQVIY